MYVDVTANDTAKGGRGKSMWCSDDAPVLSVRLNQAGTSPLGVIVAGKCFTEESACSPQYDRTSEVFLSLQDLKRIIELSVSSGILTFTPTIYGVPT